MRNGGRRPRRRVADGPPLTVGRPELLVGGSDAAFRRLVYDLLGFASRLEALRDGYGALLGLSGTRYTILITIYHLAHRGEVGITMVANHLHLSASFVTIETAKLVSGGLVAKARHPKDGRRVALAVTSRGRRALDAFAAVQRAVNDVHFGGITRAEFRTLVRVVPRLIRSTEEGLSLLRHLAQSRSALDRAATALPAGR